MHTPLLSILAVILLRHLSIKTNHFVAQQINPPYTRSIAAALMVYSNAIKQVSQLSQRNRAAACVSFGWVVDDGVGQ